MCANLLNHYIILTNIYFYMGTLYHSFVTESRHRVTAATKVPVPIWLSFSKVCIITCNNGTEFVAKQNWKKEGMGWQL